MMKQLFRYNTIFIPNLPEKQNLITNIEKVDFEVKFI